MTIRRTALILSVIAVTLTAMAASKRQSTSRGHVKAAVEAPAPTAEVAVDTLSATDPGISIVGYDKPANATRETFFIVNNTDHTVTGITVTFTYTDMQGRRLHQATHTVECEVPPGDTRNAAVPSWDRQRSFHYHLSAKPRKASTPYNVTHRIDRITVR